MVAALPAQPCAHHGREVESTQATAGAVAAHTNRDHFFNCLAIAGISGTLRKSSFLFFSSHHHATAPFIQKPRRILGRHSPIWFHHQHAQLSPPIPATSTAPLLYSAPHLPGSRPSPPLPTRVAAKIAWIYRPAFQAPSPSVSFGTWLGIVPAHVFCPESRRLKACTGNS